MTFRGRQYGYTPNQEKGKMFFSSLRESLKEQNPSSHSKPKRSIHLPHLTLKVKAFLMLSLFAVFSSVVVAQFLYQLRVPNTMVSKAHYGLELLDTSNSTIISYSWGEFDIGETKFLDAYIKNSGDVSVSVQWNLEGDEEFTSGLWSIQVLFWNGVSYEVWSKGSTLPNPLLPLEQVEIKIELTNVAGVAGTSYSFDLLFEAI